MLVEFRVKNFLSLRDEVVLSMVPTARKELRAEHTSKTNFSSVKELLNSAVIYGANASGKSTILLALKCMKHIVLKSANYAVDDKIDGTPFLLDANSKTEASCFEVSFIEKGVRYQYAFSCTQKRILSEYLYVYKRGRAQTWFTRDYLEDKKTYDYHFGSYFTGDKKTWQAATRHNALFVSTAVQLNSENLRILWNFFANKLLIIHTEFSALAQIAAEALQTQAGLKERFCAVLQAADISIDDVKVIEKDAPKEVKEFLHREKVFEVYFHHKTANGDDWFFLEDESQGTKTIFSFFLPFLFTLERGGTLLVDELNASLHPLLVKKILALFHSTEKKDVGAQLIFTTHDASLLSTDIFRRDQIWFVKKDALQASSLYSLAEFSGRITGNIGKLYLQGVYGAIPFLDEFLIVDDSNQGEAK